MVSPRVIVGRVGRLFSAVAHARSLSDHNNRFGTTMSLDRKGLRVYFTPEVHAALLALADVDRVEPAKLVEQVLEQYVVDRVHAATVIARRVDVAGLARIRPVSPGFDRTSTDEHGSTGGHKRHR